MYLCYIDESGTSDIPGNTSHFILAGLSIPISKWRECDNQLNILKKKYDLGEAEIHVAWLKRPYAEQRKIANFSSLDYKTRRSKVISARNKELYRLQRTKNNKQYKQTRKNYKKTEDYIHLTFSERESLVEDVATCIANWSYARLFAECVDKIYFDPTRSTQTIDEQSFEQVVSRFEQYLKNMQGNSYGLLIHDNNETVAKKHTNLMKRFHQQGTLWTDVSNIVETPLFVDSQLTSMVQVADLCSYALRRYLENSEEKLFDLIFQRADRIGKTTVGVRHFTSANCTCKICAAHTYSVNDS
ncbi:MAG: DUF3800 domain-containing protein [Anaerolineae bacterium]|nr:DUF3800 domain-containing protein [Anaerolineae bacterium]